MKAAMKPEMNKELKLALLGQLMSVMGQHALKGCMEPEESESDEGEDKGSIKAMLIEEPEDESMMDEKTKRLKKLKALASE